MFLEYIKMSLRDLNRRKGRTILTTIGLIIGTMLIVTMVSLGSGVNKFMVSTLNSESSGKSIQVQPLEYLSEEEREDININTYMDEYFNPITDDTIEKIKETKRVEQIIATVSGNIYDISIDGKQYKGDYQISGYKYGEVAFDKNYIENIKKQEDDESISLIKQGREIKNESGEVLLGEGMLEQFNLTDDLVLDKELDIQLNGQNKKFKVVGIIDKRFPNYGNIIMTSADVANINEIQTNSKDYLKNNGYNSLEIVANTLDDVEPLTEIIKDLNYTNISTVEMANNIDEILGNINTGFAVLGIITLLVAAIGIVNTMTMVVMERKKSIGIMKAVGASAFSVRIIFLVQSAVIGLIGSGIGILLAEGINSLAQMLINNYITEQGMNLKIIIGLPWYSILGILIFTMLIALISGIYPANKASKMNSIDALRG